MPAFYLGILFTSAASLVLQVSFSRILSVTQGYHFAFLIVSTALLGIGSAGTYLVLHLRLWSLEPGHLVVLGPLLFGVTSVGAYLALNHIPFDVVRLAWEARQIGYFLLSYLILGIPFFFSGLTIVSAFLLRKRSIGRIYFSDLVGAATGAFLPLALFPMVGGTGAVLVAAGLGTITGILLLADSRDWRVLRPVVILFSLAVLLLFGYFLFPGLYTLQLSPYRGLMVALRYPEAKLLETQWNAVSRVDRIQSPAARFAPGLSLAYSGNLPPQLGITVDGDQLHAMTAYDGTKTGMGFLEYLPSAAPYVIGQPQQVFIANPGGGLDVLMALYFDAAAVRVSEQNPLIPRLASNPMANFPHAIYQDPRVHLSIGHERSFLQSTHQVYDLVVISPLQVLGAAAVSSGIAEDYSLTLEAFREYYDHLSKNGWLVITRYLEPQPVYAVRLLATVIESLEAMSIKPPAKQLIVIRSWGTLTVLVKPEGFSAGEIQGLREFVDNRQFDLDYYPGIHPQEVNRYNRFPEPVYYRMITDLLDPSRRLELYQTYPFNIRPVSDDRPFFSYALRLDQMREIYSLVREKWLFFVEAGLLVPVMLVQAALVAALLILLPTWLRMRTYSVEAEWAKGRVFTYFFCIALGFMGVEMAMIQRLILYLAHPAYAISAVLSFILLFAGIGSILTTWWSSSRTRVQVFVMGTLALLILAQALFLPQVLNYLYGIQLPGRFGVAALLLAPMGLLMGMPFPLGMERLKQSGQQVPVAWAWAVNGSTSVVAAILSAALALQIGMTGVFIMAAMTYGIAGWMANRPWFLNERVD
jgi:hypothetical protein